MADAFTYRSRVRGISAEDRQASGKEPTYLVELAKVQYGGEFTRFDDELESPKTSGVNQSADRWVKHARRAGYRAWTYPPGGLADLLRMQGRRATVSKAVELMSGCNDETRAKEWRRTYFRRA